MTRDEVYSEMRELLGLVPTFFQHVPDSMIGAEWQLFKRLQLEDGAIPNKYRELIGLAISGVTKCDYCTFYHTETARLFGANDAEIEEAAHYAKSTTGWSAYVNSLRLDRKQFEQEVHEICEYVRQHQVQKAAA